MARKSKRHLDAVEEILAPGKTLGEILKPTLLIFTLAIVYFALSFLYVSPALSTFEAVPCKVLDTDTWGLCSLNPLGMEQSTAYFGFSPFDYVYQIIYLLIMLLLPYVLAAYTIHWYRGFVSRFY